MYEPRREMQTHGTTNYETRERNKSIIINKDFNTPLSSTDKITRKKISNIELNSTIIQQSPINIYTTLQPITAEYTFLSSIHGTHANRPYSWL